MRDAQLFQLTGESLDILLLFSAAISLLLTGSLPAKTGRNNQMGQIGIFEALAPKTTILRPMLLEFRFIG